MANVFTKKSQMNINDYDKVGMSKRVRFSMPCHYAFYVFILIIH